MNFLNIIIDNGNVREEDEEALFGKYCDSNKCSGCSFCRDEEVMRVSPDTSIFDLLIIMGSFQSKSQAKKNWKHGKDVPPGFNEFYVGKVKRHLSIWNPTE